MNSILSNSVIASRYATMILLFWVCGSTSAQHWYDYSPPPNSFDWQLFAPLSHLDAAEAPSASEGYFGTIDRMHMWLMRPNRSPVGADTGAFPPVAYVPSNVNFVYTAVTDGAGTVVIPVGQSSFLLPAAQGGNLARQFNSVDDSFPRYADGWGNRFEFGWVQDGYGWMGSVLDGEITRSDLYGFDDKRLDQLGSIQGIEGTPGIAGIIDQNGNVTVAPVAPTAPTPGFQSILGVDGLNTVHVFFQDPFNLLLGFADFNADLLPDDLNGDGLITFGTVAAGGDQVRIAVVYDDLRIDNKLELSGVELMAIRRKKRLHGGATAEVFVGARYLELDDRFNFFGRGGIASDTLINNSSLNRIVGPQFGLRISKRTNRWSTTFQGRFMAGANFLSLRQKGTIADHLSTIGFVGGNTAPSLPLNGGTDFFHRLSKERFSPTGEFRLELGFHVTKKVAVKANWTGMVVGGVSRSANTVQYVYPIMGIANKSEDLFAHGVSIGLEMNR